jgi:ATP/maltotriose-dependent transcriptional regulator MalT/DNA-binding SARP family transcriptional activator
MNRILRDNRSTIGGTGGARIVSPTSTAKVIPPAVADWYVDRPALEELLTQALARRLTTVIAGPGTGKSTLLAAWGSDKRCAWYTVWREDTSITSFGRGLVDALRLRLPGLSSDLASVVQNLHGPDADETVRTEAMAGLLTEALHAENHTDLVLVVDDAEVIPSGSAPARLLAALCRQAPDTFHLVIASRTPPPFAVERLKGRGQVLEIGAGELAFSLEETTALLDRSIDADAAALGPRVRETTGGWAAATRLAVEALRSVPPTGRGEVLDRLAHPDGPLFAYLAQEVFEAEPDDVRDLVQRVALLPRFGPALCEELGIERAEEILKDLSRRGVFVTTAGIGGDWFILNALVREFALVHLPLEAEERHETLRRAAQWFRKQGRISDALRCLETSGDQAGITELLGQQGPAALSSGAVDSVIAAARLLPEEMRNPQIEQIVGQAHLVRGDWDAALTCFHRVMETGHSYPPGLAWRMGLIYHLRGDLERAVEVYERAELDGTDRRDEALLLAWRASVDWIKGEADACRRTAAKALEAAEDAGDPQALAAVHTVLSMLSALDGDRRANETHYFLALNAAERAGDVLQLIRIRTNRSFHYVEEGYYEDALAELETVLPLAEMAGYAVFLGLACVNRGDALVGLGRLEEATAEYETAKSHYQRIGSTDLCYALCGLGDVYRERGDLAVARAAYEESIEIADAAGDLQGLVPALCGLARVLVPDEPQRAIELADRAVGFGPSLAYTKALLARGWAAAAVGDRAGATEMAEMAGKAARERRDRAGMAEAMELEVFSSEDPASKTARLHEALSIWTEIRNPLGQARVTLALATFNDPKTPRAERSRAEQILRDLGVRTVNVAASSLLHLASTHRAPVEINALGGLRLLREGRPVPVAEWQSKKARDLLKILVSRRGRPTPREVLMDLLWPDEDPSKLANRLSVALTTVRTILDPQRRFGVEHLVVADKTAVGLDLDHLSIDVEEFLARASEGSALRREGREREGLALVAEAEELYAGDFLEEDPYEDWAVALREEARATYIAVVRTLANAAFADGDFDGAVRYHLRLLERDPFDEDAHLGLVSTLEGAGRHGEARRCYRTYVARMGELGVESAPFPGAPAPEPV